MDLVSGAENICDGRRKRSREHLCWMDTVRRADNIIDGCHERSIENSGVISRA